ncbi:hypothetical protein EVAR_47538_1 [Eumeta japonica]|uniref:Uncharacterized protein n=1 Tax=Eumeta variegata TaxID=151549 RepID=A0A4C1WPF9_EUMVA|nr:hypothetical protein EVAR_47538_1 [Eumeta japonica]
MNIDNGLFKKRAYSFTKGRQHTSDSSGVAGCPWAAVVVYYPMTRFLVCSYKSCKIYRGFWGPGDSYTGSSLGQRGGVLIYVSRLQVSFSIFPLSRRRQLALRWELSLRTENVLALVKYK